MSQTRTTTAAADAYTGTADRTTFRTPFSRRYWQLAAGELRSTRMLVLAAVFTALRIVVKSFNIPVAPSLNITFGFVFNAVGSMIYGPVYAILTSAVSDTVGAILFPSGSYFFPYILEEIAGGLLFALFYYRARISALRIIIGRFAVTVICNLVISPVITYYYYLVYMGKSYSILSLPRMIKNCALFPVQCLILVALFGMLLPYTNRQELTYSGSTQLQLRRRDVLLIVILTGLSVIAIAAYTWYKGLA